MASRGRANRERDPRPIILALEALSATTRRQSARRRRTSVPRSSRSNAANRFLPDIISVHAGEDILEKIKSYFECHNIRPNFQTSYLNGHVMSAYGEVSNPTLLRQGLPVVFEGTFAIGSFSGWYRVPSNGPIELDHLKIVFYGSNGQGNAGDVTGSLTAATDVQVTVSWIGCVDEN